MVAQRHRPAAEPEQGEVGGLAGPLAEGGVEAADLLGGVAARGRQDADPRPPAGALGRQPQHQLADRAVGRARGEVVAAEGEDAPHRRRLPGLEPSLPDSRVATAIRPRPRSRAPRAAEAARRRHRRGRWSAIRVSTTRALDQVEPVALRLGPRGDDPAQLGAGEVQRGAVLGRVARRHPLAQEAVVGEAAARLRLVVDAVAERQQPQALDPARLAVEAGHRLGEPAQRAGREAAEDDPRLPGLAQDPSIPCARQTPSRLTTLPPPT